MGGASWNLVTVGHLTFQEACSIRRRGSLSLSPPPSLSLLSPLFEQHVRANYTFQSTKKENYTFQSTKKKKYKFLPAAISTTCSVGTYFVLFYGLRHFVMLCNCG